MIRKKRANLMPSTNSEYPEGDIETIRNEAESTHWHCLGNVYFPAKPTVPELPPGFYKVFRVFGEMNYVKQELCIEGIFPTGSANAAEIMEDFDKFWGSEELFAKYEVPYQRGILLSGPPGSGKTCIIKLLADRMINEYKGAVLDLRSNPDIVGDAISTIHSIQPEMPLMVVMEDIDHYYYEASEALLNVMDGLYIIDKVVFVATTNSVHKLEDALVNRPGRFDTHYQIKPAHSKVREAFIRSLLPEEDLSKISVEQWAKDTKDLPFGHIKELVVSVMVLNKDYKKTLERLRHMKEGQEDEDEELFDKPGYN